MKSLKVVSAVIAVRGEGNMDKLKACPFCGAEATIYKSLKADVWFIGCEGKYDNLCPGYIWKCAPVYLSKEAATRAWNRRERSV